MNQILFMQRAIELALEGYGQTSPNPLVGAVIVKNGRVVGSGFHKKAGLAHAEINAIRQAGKKAAGADLFVTLEPCCHFGKTPPCTENIIKAGIKRVFYGMKDPNPLVSGQGLEQLKKAGIKIIGPILEDACVKLNRPFIKWVTTGLPFVTLKIAITLDGRIADYKGDSQWISNEASRNYTHLLRAGVDIVMVGSNTAKKDKPKLNVRIKGYKGKQPIKMIVGINAGHKTNLKKLFKELGEAGFQSILVEGGGKLHTDIIKNGLVDHLVVFIAPKILGERGITWISSLGKISIKHPIQIIPENLFTLGGDVVVEGKIV